jgi:hypothetical protein
MDLRDSTESKTITALIDFVTSVGVSASGGRPTVKAISPLVGDRLRRSTIAQLCIAASRRPFTITVPGTHPPPPRTVNSRASRGGSRTISYQRLFDYLERLGKPFLEESKTMRDRMRSDLLIEFENSSEVPLLLEFDVCMTDSAGDTVRARMDNKIRDVRIRSNSGRWDRFKAAHGYDSRTGSMLRSRPLYSSTLRLRLR